MPVSEQILIKTRIEAGAYKGLRARTVSNEGLLPSESFHLLNIQLLPQQSELELDGGQEVEGFSAMSGLHICFELCVTFLFICGRIDIFWRNRGLGGVLSRGGGAFGLFRLCWGRRGRIA